MPKDKTFVICRQCRIETQVVQRGAIQQDNYRKKPDLCSMGMPLNFCYYFACGLDFLITTILMFPSLRNRLAKCQGKCKLINNRSNIALQICSIRVDGVSCVDPDKYQALMRSLLEATILDWKSFTFTERQLHQ